MAAPGSMGPSCPSCGHDRSKVMSRSNGTSRRRVCALCAYRFTTYETVGPVVSSKNETRLRKARDLITEILDGAGIEEAALKSTAAKEGGE